MTVRRACHLTVASGMVASLALAASPAAADVAHRNALASRSESSDEREPRRDVVISSDDEFDAAHGVRSGSGTASDPYVISNWKMMNLTIHDTDSYVAIVDNEIGGRLVLDWVGDRITVTNNDIWDLRVNRNVKRTGEPTSGAITGNRFGVVGQLRHWDGVFADNVIGARDNGSPFYMIFGRRAVNFDGFNGAVFRDNTIYGYMDARLHGHHHSSGFGEDSHYHGSHADGHSDEPPLDHSQRYHEVWVTGNTIYSDHSYALAYLDTAHAANDRTAASEQNEALRGPHVHYTRVHMTDNDLVGAGVLVNVFNAEDDRHTGTTRGLVELAHNRISIQPRSESKLFTGRPGIYVRRAQDVDVHITDNSVTGPRYDEDNDFLGLKRAMDGDAGILLDSLDKANVYIYDNTLAHRRCGICARRFTESVHWWIRNLATTDVENDVHYDKSVSNPPNEGP